MKASELNDEYNQALESLEEFYKQELFEEEEGRKLISEIKSKVSKEFCEDLDYCLKEGYCYGFEIVENPIGELQFEDELTAIGGYYVNQIVNGGYTGDCYEGSIFIKLPYGGFLKYNYSM